MNIYHGTIISCDSNNTIYQYLVEDKGKIVYTGDQLPSKFEGVKITELGKHVLLPSFADTHLHFASMALFHAGVNVMKVVSNIELKEKLKEFLPKTIALGWSWIFSYDGSYAF